MATTEAKPGFRLPWSSDRSESANAADAASDPAVDESSNATQENETPAMIDAVPAASDNQADVEAPSSADPTPAAEWVPMSAPTPASEPAPIAAARKPNKFMADLSKAMQAAAETAREETLARFGAEAKAHIEGIQASTSTEATDPVKAEHAIGALFPKRDWTMLSHHLIWHGRRVCDARRPRCDACVLADLCPSRRGLSPQGTVPREAQD